VKRIFIAGALCAAFWGIGSLNVNSYDVGMRVASAQQPSLSINQRELKKSPDHQVSDVYTRAHHLIYGDKAPLGPDGRVRIALVINGDEDMVVENRVKNQIYQQIRDKFPRESFAIMKGTDINTYLLEKAENDGALSKGNNFSHPSSRYTQNEYGVSEKHGESVSSNKTNDVDDMPVGNRPRGLADMRLNDYVEAGRRLDYDYVFVLTMTLSNRVKYQKGVPLLFTTHTSEQNIWMRARFVDVKKEHYVYRNDLPAKGEAHNGHFNGRIYEQSVTTVMKEILDDIAITE